MHDQFPVHTADVLAGVVSYHVSCEVVRSCSLHHSVQTAFYKRNVAEDTELCTPVSSKYLSYCRETALQGGVSFGQKWKTGTGIQYFADIIGLSLTTVT